MPVAFPRVGGNNVKKTPTLRNLRKGRFQTKTP